MSTPQVYFNRDELTVISMGIATMLDNFKENDLMPWNEETRKHIKEMRAACNSVAAKLKKHAGIECELPPYIDGEERDYFTKES